jgi:hypothetical protein
MMPFAKRQPRAWFWPCVVLGSISIVSIPDRTSAQAWLAVKQQATGSVSSMGIEPQARVHFAQYSRQQLYQQQAQRRAQMQSTRQARSARQGHGARQTLTARRTQAVAAKQASGSKLVQAQQTAKQAKLTAKQAQSEAAKRARIEALKQAQERASANKKALAEARRKQLALKQAQADAATRAKVEALKKAQEQAEAKKALARAQEQRFYQKAQSGPVDPAKGQPKVSREDLIKQILQVLKRLSPDSDEARLRRAAERSLRHPDLEYVSILTRVLDDRKRGQKLADAVDLADRQWRWNREQDLAAAAAKEKESADRTAAAAAADAKAAASAAAKLEEDRSASRAYDAAMKNYIALQTQQFPDGRWGLAQVWNAEKKAEWERATGLNLDAARNTDAERRAADMEPRRWPVPLPVELKDPAPNATPPRKPDSYIP